MRGHNRAVDAPVEGSGGALARGGRIQGKTERQAVACKSKNIKRGPTTGTSTWEEMEEQDGDNDDGVVDDES